MPVGADGLSVYGPVITKFSRMGRLRHFLTHGAPLARFARECSAINIVFPIGGSVYSRNQKVV